ncbi:MAG: glycosyltransferase [Actinomycetota bacterium]|nr:glycosyltransferase [Actinomycetota bacterium]
MPLVASEHNCIAWPDENHDTAARAHAPRLARMFAHGPAATAWAREIGVPAERLEGGESPVEGFDDTPVAGLQEPRITFTGRLMADKAPDVLVEALARMPDPPATYVLGDGVLRGALRDRAAALGLGTVVRFPGWQPQPGRWVAGAAVHCVPSREEAWSQSAVLAMGLGVPVVGTDVEGLPDTLGQDRGLLVPPEDPDALAAALDAVLRGERTTDIAGAQAYARRFAPARVAARYAAVYRDILAGEPELLPA